MIQLSSPYVQNSSSNAFKNVTNITCKVLSKEHLYRAPLENWTRSETKTRINFKLLNIHWILCLGKHCGLLSNLFSYQRKCVDEPLLAAIGINQQCWFQNEHHCEILDWLACLKTLPIVGVGAQPMMYFLEVCWNKHNTLWTLLGHPLQTECLENIDIIYHWFKCDHLVDSRTCFVIGFTIPINTQLRYYLKIQQVALPSANSPRIGERQSWLLIWAGEFCSEFSKDCKQGLSVN